MRIRAFHIDGFGLLRDVTVDDLPGGCAVFLGRNEAGKSTLLDFFRAVLTGYPPRPRERERFYASAGQAGGTLSLDTEAGTLRLTRRPGPGGGEASLTDGQGNPLDLRIWERLLGSVTREVYTSVYGFSLTELQTFATLTSDGVRNALYGASFGMGLRSPGRALKQLETDMEKLFKPGGSKQQISLLLREWEDTGREIREAGEEAARFDALAAEREERLGELAALRSEASALDAERRGLERRLGVWRQWEEWRLTGARLGRLETVPGTFPPDGPARLERARDHQENAERDAALAEARVRRTRALLEALAVDPALAGCANRLRDLNERKASCRNALAEIPRLRRELERCAAEQERQLRTLGPGWTLERVRRADRPLRARENLTRRAEEIRIAAAELTAAEAALEKARHEEGEAERGLTDAAARLENLPAPAAELDMEAREELRRLLAGMEEARRRLPEREKALEQARGEFNRALAHLHLRPRQSTAQALDALSAAQEEALRLAGEVVSKVKEASEAGHRADRARDEEEQARTRLQRLRNRKDDLGDPNRTDLEKRRAVLRDLRAAAAMLPVEANALQEAEDRYAAHMADSPAAGRHPLLIALGVLLALCGGSLIVALKVWDVRAVRLAAGFEWPLVLWHGYLVLLAGVAFLAAGLPRRRPEAARHAIVAGQLRARREALETRLRERREEVNRLCGLLDVKETDSAVLDALERDLDREREQCAANERLEKELAEHEDELAALQRRTQWEEAECGRRNAEAQNARRRWHELLMDFGVQSVPAPEAAPAYFARVDSARAVWSGVAALEREVAEMESRGPKLAEAGRRLLPERAWPETWAPAPAAAAVRAVLESCRRADLAAEQRAAAAEAVRAAETLLARERAAARGALEALEAASSGRERAGLAWEQALADLGLDAGLSPATATEALRCADAVLRLETERSRLRDQLNHQERERDALVLPVREIAESLGRNPEHATSGAGKPVAEGEGEPAGWLRVFDVLLEDAEQARRALEEQTRLSVLLAEQEGEWQVAAGIAADAARETGKLLRLAGAVDDEDFLRRFALKTERDELVRRREDLEDSLRLAAADADFDAYVRGFAETEKETLEARTAEIAGRLANLAERIETLSDAERTLRVRLEGLSASDKAASLRLRRATAAESLQRMGLEWGRNALARHLLNMAKQRFEKERQPEVIRIASNMYRSITNGAWTGISASLEDSSLRVLPPHGDAVSPELLSRGAQEQLYLALRLAHIRNHAAQAAALPVIMDDILVNFDPRRAERTAAVFGEMTGPGEGAPGNQILFFTCHPHIADMLCRAVADSALYAVEKGRVTRV